MNIEKINEKYCLHDCVINKIGIKDSALILYADKGIYEFDVNIGTHKIRENCDILIKIDNLNEKVDIKTEEEKLGPALLNEEGYKISDGMVTTVKGIDLSGSTFEYWHITVNGEDAQVGANDQVIKNGDTIKFERIKFK